MHVGATHRIDSIGRARRRAPSRRPGMAKPWVVLGLPPSCYPILCNAHAAVLNISHQVYLFTNNNPCHAESSRQSIAKQQCKKQCMCTRGASPDSLHCLGKVCAHLLEHGQQVPGLFRRGGPRLLLWHRHAVQHADHARRRRPRRELQLLLR